MEKESKFEQVKGNVKETVGNVTENEKMEQEGKKDKIVGEVKETVEKVEEKAKDLIDKFKK